MAAFFTNRMADVAADQLPNGSVPYVIPDVLNGAAGSTAWADAAIIIPWNMYLAYGDERILEVQYPSMKAWVDYMQERAGAERWMDVLPFRNTGEHHGHGCFAAYC